MYVQTTNTFYYLQQNWLFWKWFDQKGVWSFVQKEIIVQQANIFAQDCQHSWGSARFVALNQIRTSYLYKY